MTTHFGCQECRSLDLRRPIPWDGACSSEANANDPVTFRGCDRYETLSPTPSTTTTPCPRGNITTGLSFYRGQLATVSPRKSRDRSHQFYERIPIVNSRFPDASSV